MRANKVIAKIIGLVIVALLFFGIKNYLSASNFPVKKVQIFAAGEHLASDLLSETISKYLRDGFFYLKINQLKQDLLNDPWIYAVAIKRKWPDTLVVSLVEQQAFLKWGEAALVNPKGEVFVPAFNTIPEQLPVVFGKEEFKPEIIKLYQQATVLLAPLGLIVTKVIFNDNHYWEITFSDGMVVFLKESDPLNQLELLTKLYRRIIGNRTTHPKTIDLRYSSGMAVKW